MKKQERKPIVDFCRNLLQNSEGYDISEQMQAMMIVQLETILSELVMIQNSGVSVEVSVGNAMRSIQQDFADFCRDNRR